MIKLYKITTEHRPESHILIKGRMLGMYTVISLVFLAIVAFIFFISCISVIQQLSAGILFFGGLSGVACLALSPFISSFEIEITPVTVKIIIRYFGIPVAKLQSPLTQVIAVHADFSNINKEAKRDWDNRADYMTLDYDDAYDGPVYYITVYFKGKEVVFTGISVRFEAELWQNIVAAFKEIYKIKGLA